VTDPTLFLNGFRIELSAERFRAWTWPLPEESTIAELRAQHPEWSLWASGDAVLAVPATNLAEEPQGEEIELDCRDELTFISYLVNAALPRHIQA